MPSTPAGGALGGGEPGDGWPRLEIGWGYPSRHLDTRLPAPGVELDAILNAGLVRALRAFGIRPMAPSRWRPMDSRRHAPLPDKSKPASVGGEMAQESLRNPASTATPGRDHNPEIQIPQIASFRTGDALRPADSARSIDVLL